MSLPYDYSRCVGTSDPLCKTCLRTDPGNPLRQASFVTPPLSNGKCGFYVPGKSALDTERFRLTPSVS